LSGRKSFVLVAFVILVFCVSSSPALAETIAIPNCAACQSDSAAGSRAIDVLEKAAGAPDSALADPAQATLDWDTVYAYLAEHDPAALAEPATGDALIGEVVGAIDAGLEGGVVGEAATTAAIGTVAAGTAVAAIAAGVWVHDGLLIYHAFFPGSGTTSSGPSWPAVSSKQWISSAYNGAGYLDTATSTIPLPLSGAAPTLPHVPGWTLTYTVSGQIWSGIATAQVSYTSCDGSTSYITPGPITYPSTAKTATYQIQRSSGSMVGGKCTISNFGQPAIRVYVPFDTLRKGQLSKYQSGASPTPDKTVTHPPFPGRSTFKTGVEAAVNRTGAPGRIGQALTEALFVQVPSCAGVASYSACAQILDNAGLMHHHHIVATDAGADLDRGPGAVLAVSQAGELVNRDSDIGIGTNPDSLPLAVPPLPETDDRNNPCDVDGGGSFDYGDLIGPDRFTPRIGDPTNSSDPANFLTIDAGPTYLLWGEAVPANDWNGWGWRHIQTAHGFGQRAQLETRATLADPDEIIPRSEGVDRYQYNSKERYVVPNSSILCMRIVVVERERIDPLAQPFEQDQTGIWTSYGAMVS
jgi:hypothetical protein